jgi:uncharacterized membrane protein (UPF0127 family)
MRVFVLLAAALALCGCKSDSDANASLEALRTTMVTLPNGKGVRAELAIDEYDQARGLMFRDTLPEGRGMLFVHRKPAVRSYWMYQVRIPLDIIFMDSNRRVLGVAANAPPCTTRSSECPTYGGFDGTQYVLELGAGQAAKNGVTPGVSLTF